MATTFERWAASVPYPFDAEETRLARAAWYAALEAAATIAHKPYKHGLGWEAAQAAIVETIEHERGSNSNG